ncbi:MAG: lipopolysaccharide biosynthesis protein [Prevotella sp.]|nr:lipopolysaccharide biosynthesis protein [Prevotella sp.]
MASDLRQKTFSGMIWTFLESFSLQIFGFVQGIILARLLNPSDYGLIAMTAIFFSISHAMIDSGFTNALVRKKNHIPIDFSTVYVTNVVLSLVFSIILCLVSPWVANFYDQPILKPIMCWNALCMFFQSFIAVQGTRMRIQLRFKDLSKIHVATTILTGVFAIILAFLGFGVWSLVYPNLFRIIIRGLFFWHYQHWFPGFLFTWVKFREFFSYGSRLMAANLINTTFNNLYPLVIGKYYSAKDLGFYNKAQGYASLPAFTVTGILTKVTFPVLAKVNDDTVILQSVYRRMIRQSAFIAFPILMGLAALAKPAILLMITEKWATSIPLLQVLCFSMMWTPIHVLNLNLLQVRGKSGLFLNLEIVKKILFVIILLATFKFGILYMAIGEIVMSILCLFINTHYTGKLINVSFIRQMKDIFPSFLYALSMGILIYLITIAIDNLWLQVISGIIVGAVYYISIAKLFKSPELDYCITLLRENVFHKKH